MLTKKTIHLIKQLHEKKYRQEYGLFLVEGEKSVAELLHADFTIEHLFITADFYTHHASLVKNINHSIVEPQEIENMSSLEHNVSALAVVAQKKNSSFDMLKTDIVLALDTIRDPGNLGTILRTADWYGITKIVASPTTTDLYNPKVIAASMGSFCRVHMWYTDLPALLTQSNIPVLGAFLTGDNVHTFQFPTAGILVMGNESHGISPEVEKIITQKIMIPSYGNAESLNVGTATAVILDNWKRMLTPHP